MIVRLKTRCWLMFLYCQFFLRSSPNRAVFYPKRKRLQGLLLVLEAIWFQGASSHCLLTSLPGLYDRVIILRIVQGSNNNQLSKSQSIRVNFFLVHRTNPRDLSLTAECNQEVCKNKLCSTPHTKKKNHCSNGKFLFILWFTANNIIKDVS